MFLREYDDLKTLKYQKIVKYNDFIPKKQWLDIEKNLHGSKNSNMVAQTSKYWSINEKKSLFLFFLMHWYDHILILIF